MNAIFLSQLCPGDLLVMGTALRALVKATGWRVAARCRYPEIFEHLPFLSALNSDEALTYEIGYHDAVQQSNISRRHFASGYLRHINRLFSLDVALDDLRPPIQLVESDFRVARELKRPYWVLMAGGKRCFVTKWWDPTNYQRVVNMTRDRWSWVQMGASEHVHFPLNHTVNLIDQTTLRESFGVLALAEGVLCPVTYTMHAAAALNKPCVVVAGGREPFWWEAYTEDTWRYNINSAPPADFVPHRYIHSIGAMTCSLVGGCWRTQLKSGDPSKVCLNVVKGPLIDQAECLGRISPEQVVEEIDFYK